MFEQTTLNADCVGNNLPTIILLEGARRLL
jgi:hypothetical protein